jgi:putative membrane protein
MVLLVYLLLSWLANIVSLAVADWIFDGVTIDGMWPLIVGAAVLGIANTIIKPLLTLLTLPLVIVTLGLFYFVINVFMLVLAEWIAPDFSIDGFWTYVGATIVVSIVNWAMHAIFGMFESSKKPQLAS